jgi:phosphate transport system substrate-binding protein
MENKAYGSGETTFTNYAGIENAVAQDPNGIGYCSFDLENKAGVKAISIQGVMPSKESVNQGKYPYSRVLRFYTSKATESPAALEFIQFVQSSRGQQVLDEMGFVPKL